MWWFYRNGPSGFSGASTAEEVTAGVDCRGLVAVVTGRPPTTSPQFQAGSARMVNSSASGSGCKSRF